jgi:hypothetical protein
MSERSELVIITVPSSPRSGEALTGAPCSESGRTRAHGEMVHQ